jgi:hypothetical protein
MIHLSIGHGASSSTNLPDICHGLYDRTLLIKQPMTDAWQIYSAACAATLSIFQVRIIFSKLDWQKAILPGKLPQQDLKATYLFCPHRLPLFPFAPVLTIHLSIGKGIHSSTNLPDIRRRLYDQTLLIIQPTTNAWQICE